MPTNVSAYLAFNTEVPICNPREKRRLQDARNMDEMMKEEGMGVEAEKEEKLIQDSEVYKQVETSLAVRMANLGEFLGITQREVKEHM